ncbi:MAG: hypothetical protein H6983_22380 [Ectothiorhodospiraceae bacterium]|nr:hypothetical protein [Ectothiorhodospiraceae bacterium]
MSLGEFELIARHFRAPTAARDDVVLGVGDDGAVVRVPPGAGVVTVACSVAGEPGDDGREHGEALMARALLRLRGRGARPAWALLALTVPSTDRPWLTPAIEGLRAVAGEQGVALIGGDTTRGPAMLTVFAHGLASAGTTGPEPDAAWSAALIDGGDRPARLLRALPALESLAVVGADASDGLALALDAVAERTGCRPPTPVLGAAPSAGGHGLVLLVAAAHHAALCGRASDLGLRLTTLGPLQPHGAR